MTKLEEAGFAGRAAGFSRRDLVRAIGLSAGGMALGLSSLGGGSKAFAAAPGSVYTSAQLWLELDGDTMPVYSAEGGNAVAVVVPDPPTGEGFQRKHMGAVRYEDLILQVGLVSSKALTGWISQTFTKGPAAKNGALVTTNYTGAEVRRLEFSDAMITEVTLAPMDASDIKKSDPFQLTLRLAPEMTRLVGPTGKASSKTLGMKDRGARYFRFNIQGLESATARTAKIGALTVKRGGGGQQTGKERIEQRQFGAIRLLPRQHHSA